MPWQETVFSLLQITLLQSLLRHQRLLLLQWLECHLNGDPLLHLHQLVLRQHLWLDMKSTTE